MLQVSLHESLYLKSEDLLKDNHFLGIKGIEIKTKKVIGYCRVSSHKQKDDIERQIENPAVELTNESIGIDVGIKDLAICSNGMTFKNINKTRAVKKLKKTLKRKQRQC